MELKNIFGEVIFALDGAKTVLELVTAAVAAKKSLNCASLAGARLVGARLDGASLYGASLYGARLDGASLDGASLYGARLDGASLYGQTSASLYGARLDGASLDGALIDGKPIVTLRVFSGLYKYQVWAVLFKDGSRKVRMGCLFYNLDKWETIGIRKSNPSEFPDDGSERSENRAAAFEFAKAAALRMVKP